MGVVSKINLKLPFDKRINVIDAFEWEEFGLRNLPLIEKFNKDGLKEGFPFLYVSGTIVEPAPTAEQLMIVLETLLKKEFII